MFSNNNLRKVSSVVIVMYKLVQMGPERCYVRDLHGGYVPLD